MGQAKRNVSRGATAPPPNPNQAPTLLIDWPSCVWDVIESDDRHHEERGRSGTGAIAAARRAAASIGLAILKLPACSHDAWPCQQKARRCKSWGASSGRHNKADGTYASLT